MKKSRASLLSVFVLSAAVLVFILLRWDFATDTEGDVEISETQLDAQLIEREVPSDVLDEMDYFQKLNIITHLDEGERFVGYTEYDVEFYEDGLKRYINPKSEMDLEVVVFKQDSIYNFFPSFKWDAKVRLSNDTFGFSLDERYWTTVAGEVGLSVYLENSDEEVKDFFRYDRASNSTFHSHSFTILNQDGNKNARDYSGHAHFKAESLADETDTRITLSYTKNPVYFIDFGLFVFGIGDDETKVKETTYPLIWE